MLTGLTTQLPTQLAAQITAAGGDPTKLIANPNAAVATPWQFLPEPWGAIGQLFVPGASNWLLRSVNYFPDASDAQQWLVLLGWIVLGLALAAIAAARTRKALAVVEEAA